MSKLDARIMLRQALRSDDEFLLNLYASTRQEELAPLPWSDVEKADFVRMQYDAQRTDYSRRFPGSDHSIVIVDGTDAGRIWVDRGEDEIRPIDIALIPALRGMGVGTQLLTDLQKEAGKRGLSLRHSVHKTNLGAIRFYIRMGFSAVQDYQTHDLMEWSGKFPDGTDLEDVEEVLD